MAELNGKEILFNPQFNTGSSDYDDLTNKPIINQDLSADGFTPVENTYYKHTGSTSDTYTAGVVYFYNGTAYKAIDGGGEQKQADWEQTDETAADFIKNKPTIPTVPASLPQTAGALKSGTLPTSGWTAGEFRAYWEGQKQCGYNSPTLITTNKAYADKCWASSVSITLKVSTSSFQNAYDTSAKTWANYGTTTVNDETARIYKTGNYSTDTIYVTQTGKIYGKGYTNGLARYNPLYVVKLGFADETAYNYTISDTDIVANSDVLMELTDEGGVKAYSLESGKITVTRDAVPTALIPYTYKVKQTNGAGQFTLLNHYDKDTTYSAATESADGLMSSADKTKLNGIEAGAQVNPTSLPVVYAKFNGALTFTEQSASAPWFIGQDMAQWEENPLISMPASTQNKSLGLVAGNQYTITVNKNGTVYSSTATAASAEGFVIAQFTFSQEAALMIMINDNVDITAFEVGEGAIIAANLGEATSAIITTFTGELTGGFVATVENAAIKVNSSVKMYLNSDVKISGTKADGVLTLTAKGQPENVTYEAEVFETESEGLIEIVNSYVPNPSIPSKTSDLTNDSGFLTKYNIISGDNVTISFENSDVKISASNIGEWVTYVQGDTLEDGTYLMKYDFDAIVTTIINGKTNYFLQSTDIDTQFGCVTLRYEKFKEGKPDKCKWVKIAGAREGDPMSIEINEMDAWAGFKYIKLK